jgi:hypothetical protein
MRKKLDERKRKKRKKENGTKVRLKDGRKKSAHDLKEEERRKEKIN